MASSSDRSQARGRAPSDTNETTDRVLSDRRRAAETERQRRQFEQAPGFVVKNKNAINEKLFVESTDFGGLNPYAMIIINEARRPVILAGRVSRSEAAWTTRIELAETLAARVASDLKVAAAFPTAIRWRSV